jgi:Amt family ammonium transporter
MRRAIGLAVAMAVGGLPTAALAEAPKQTIDSGDTAWMLISAAFVLFMTPGLALFYGGMVKKRNVLSTFMFVHFALALVFQMKFAIITPALIAGAFVERFKFSAYVLFTLLWTTLVYDPVAHWAWADGGWLGNMGVLDFAGGTVVHLTAGVSALVCALVLGKRLGYPKQKSPPHNLTMTVLGGGLLWFGWFGFNAGSALSANGIAALAFVTTHVSAAAAAAAWVGIEWAHRRKPTMLGFVSGLVAGLVAITPACGYVSPSASILIGAASSCVCYLAVQLKERLHYDDSLDAFGVHGVGGILGALLTGVFATKALNASGADGLLHGNPALLGKQVIAVVVVGTFSAAMTFGLLKLVNKLVGLRVTEDEEREGLDETQHGETGYAL